MRLLIHGCAAGVRVWRFDLDTYARATALDGLAPGERSRAARMRPHVARRALAARHALRAVAGTVLSCAPEDVHLDTDVLGKPFVRDAPLHLNLSRSGATCVIAVSARQPVGIDVECVRPMDDAARLAALHFTHAEREAWSLTRADGDFLRCWTRKEACLKALGVGLRISPTAVDAGCTGSARIVEIRLGERTSAVEVHTLAGMPDCVVAVAFADAADVEYARHAAALP